MGQQCWPPAAKGSGGMHVLGYVLCTVQYSAVHVQYADDTCMYMLEKWYKCRCEVQSSKDD